MARFEIKGINDDKDTCMCCGKEGLKKVVWIEDTETLEVGHYGTSCAANPAKCFGIGKREIAKAVREFEHRQNKARREARQSIVSAALAANPYKGEMIKKTFSDHMMEIFKRTRPETKKEYYVAADEAAQSAHRKAVEEAAKKSPEYLKYSA